MESPPLCAAFSTPPNMLFRFLEEAFPKPKSRSLVGSLSSSSLSRRMFLRWRKNKTTTATATGILHQLASPSGTDNFFGFENDSKNHLHDSQDDGERRVRWSNWLLASVGGIRRGTGRARARSTQQGSNGLEASAQVHSRSHPRNLCVTRNEPSRGRVNSSSSYEAHLSSSP